MEDREKCDKTQFWCSLPEKLNGRGLGQACNAELFVHCEEFWAVEVNHVGWIRFYPDFCFPCDVVDMPFEFPKIKECTDVNFFCFASYKHLLQFNLPVGRKRAV